MSKSNVTGANNKQTTFSRQVKDELCTVLCTAKCCRLTELCAAFYAAGRVFDDTIILSTAHVGCADRLISQIRNQYRSEIRCQSGRELMSLTIDDSKLFTAICEDMNKLFGYDPTKASNRGGKLTCTTECCQHAILRAIFLTCGSISEPSTAYHLELSIRQNSAAEMISRLLEQYGIRTGLIKRHGYNVVYIKEGQYISDFLLLTGAHLSLLTFESLRVEKEMRNSVNRVVNCDSANTQRIANTAARQLELIRQVMEKYDIGLLPTDLRAAAEIRLDNPDLSLKELGELMNPPLGKSGMNHRLKRLEQIAADILSKQRG